MKKKFSMETMSLEREGDCLYPDCGGTLHEQREVEIDGELLTAREDELGWEVCDENPKEHIWWIFNYGAILKEEVRRYWKYLSDVWNFFYKPGEGIESLERAVPGLVSYHALGDLIYFLASEERSIPLPRLKHLSWLATSLLRLTDGEGIIVVHATMYDKEDSEKQRLDDGIEDVEK